MILHVRVYPKANRCAVIKQNEDLKVYLTQPANNGLANHQLINLLSEYLHIKKYQIEIIKGHKSRDKLIEIDV